MLNFVRRNYLSIDPRTLGLLRIGIAGLLLFDLARRVSIMRLFYTNAGLIPNHRILWRPPREHMFSLLLAFSKVGEVQVAFALFALIYTCLLLGYRTRLMQVLSWLSLISLQLRADILSSGAEFVFGLLVLWSAFLPLGRRFSVDALLRSLRTQADSDLRDLQARTSVPRDTQPVVSLAVLALVTQLAVIYFFNTVHKNGDTWRDGTAVYWLLHQERIVTGLGFWAREALPLATFQFLTYATLVFEGLLPALILSPWGRPWTRRAAILSIWTLHTGMALMSNLGVFSPVMMVYALCLVEPRDWELWERWNQRKRPMLRLMIDPSCGLSFQLARLWARLDLFGRIEVLAASPDANKDAAIGVGWVETEDGQRFTGRSAIHKLLSVLPLRFLWLALALLLRPLGIVAWLERHRTKLARELALRSANDPSCTPSDTQADGHRIMLRAGLWTTQAIVLVLIIVATTQVLVENPSIPSALRIRQPQAIHAAIDYLRLNQGWSMFAPNAPTRDLWVVVDAETVDGRRIDPWNDIASRVSDPQLRTIPPRLAQDSAFCDYSSSLPAAEELHEPFRDWILNHHHRTHRPQDQIKRFKAYVIEQDSPSPTDTTPRNITARVFLRD